ncbi:MAG: hypothetical protein AABX07_01600 [Nanoarchaeota archaeon]
MNAMRRLRRKLADVRGCSTTERRKYSEKQETYIGLDLHKESI